MYKEIIEKNWKSGNEVIMSKSVDMVSDLLKNVNYPLAKDSWASGFAEKRPFKRLALTSSPPV